MSKPIEVKSNVRVEIEFPNYGYWRNPTPEQEITRLNGRIKDFEDFLRDHRSQDSVGFSVVYDTGQVCSACNKPWEVYRDGDNTCCAWCGEAVE